jgi:hypothetical protein
MRLLRELGKDPGPPGEAKTLQDLRAILEREHCLRHQALVQKGLALYNLENGTSFGLTTANSRQLILDLVRMGYLTRPYAEPSERGEFRSGIDGAIWCTLHGGDGSSPAAAGAGSRVPRLARTKVPEALLTQVLLDPTPSAVVVFAERALRQRNPDMLPQLVAGLSVMKEDIDLALVLDDLNDVTLVADSPLPRIEDPPVWLLRHPSPEIRQKGSILLVRTGHPASLDTEDLVEMLRRAQKGELSSKELSLLLKASLPSAGPRLSEHVATMPLADSADLIPALASLGDRQILIALARRLPDCRGIASWVAPLLLKALEEATGRSATRDVNAWIAVIERSVPERK